MVSHLITLPVRLGVRATRLWFRAVEETFSVTISTTERVIELLSHRGSSGTQAQSPFAPAPARPAPAERREPRDQTAEAPRPARPAPPPEALPPSAQPAAPPSPPEPVHVSEEPMLVEEFAEPGAEEGAGAEVHVDAPWEGYEHMNAKQVNSRLSSASPEELAAVQLYELTHRRRQTIVNAVERELRKADGRGSQRQERG